MATLADGDLNDLPEVKQSLVEMKKRREILEARQADIASPVPVFSEQQTKEWASAKLRDIGVALQGKTNPETMRRMVHDCVARIEIEPEEEFGRLFVPADAWALLQLAAVRRGTSASSSHSWRVLVAA